MIIADIDLLVQCCVLLMISLYASVLNVRIITEVSIPLLKSFKHSILPLFSYNVVLVDLSTAVRQVQCKRSAFLMNSTK